MPRPSSSNQDRPQTRPIKIDPKKRPTQPEVKPNVRKPRGPRNRT